MIFLIGKILRANKKTRKQGFTLVEIILVVVLLGIVAGLAFPDLSRVYDQFQLNQKVDNLAYLMRYAQSRAVIEGEKQRMVFTSDKRKYWLEEKVNDNEGVEEKYHRISGRLGRSFTLPRRMTATVDGETALFYPDGTMDKIQITVCHKKYCRRVSTKKINGYVYVF